MAKRKKQQKWQSALTLIADNLVNYKISQAMLDAQHRRKVALKKLDVDSAIKQFNATNRSNMVDKFGRLLSWAQVDSMPPSLIKERGIMTKEEYIQRRGLELEEELGDRTRFQAAKAEFMEHLFSELYTQKEEVVQVKGKDPKLPDALKAEAAVLESMGYGHKSEIKKEDLPSYKKLFNEEMTKRAKMLAPENASRTGDSTDVVSVRSGQYTPSEVMRMLQAVEGTKNFAELAPKLEAYYAKDSSERQAFERGVTKRAKQAKDGNSNALKVKRKPTSSNKADVIGDTELEDKVDEITRNQHDSVEEDTAEMGVKMKLLDDDKKSLFQEAGEYWSRKWIDSAPNRVKAWHGGKDPKGRTDEEIRAEAGINANATTNTIGALMSGEFLRSGDDSALETDMGYDEFDATEEGVQEDKVSTGEKISVLWDLYKAYSERTNTKAD